MQTDPTPDLATLTDDALAEAVTTLAAHIHATTYRLLVLIAELDRREVWAAHGARSCAHWLGWACGIDARTAREKVRTAHALDSLPLLSEALRRGELSYSKVRALTRIATPDNEADLLNIGLSGTAGHVDTAVRLYRRALRVEEREEADRQHEERSLRWWQEDDGTVVLQGRFPAETGARIVATLEAAIDAHESEQPAGGWHDEARAPAETEPEDGSYPQGGSRGVPPLPPPRERRRADALLWMCEKLREGVNTPALAANDHQVVVHVDAAVLSDPGTEGRCHLEDGHALAVDATRRLCCDGGIVAMVDGPAGEPLAVGRRTRAVPPAMRRALHSRDGGCRFPGCGSTHRLHAHHVRHWADGGETRVENLVLLCPLHHRLVHEGGFDVVRLDDGTFRFTTPYGQPVAPPVPSTPPSADSVLRDNEARGLHIHPRTPVARWDGEPFDYDLWLVAALATRARQAREGPDSDPFRG